MDSQELKAGDTLNLLTILTVTFFPPEVNNDLLGLLCVEGQVIVSAALVN